MPPEKHYYTTTKLFEQSLDIYRPKAAAAAGDRRKSGDAPTTVVVLVVGSAWLGHRAGVYSGTSWWNSSGPRAVADAGRICVCVRHRGSYMRTFSVLTMAFLGVVAALATTLAYAVLGESAWKLLEERIGKGIGGDVFGRMVGVFFVAYATGIVLMALGGIGSASFDDMQHDVMDALAWLHANEVKLGLDRHPTTKRGGGYSNEVEWKYRRRRLFVFGGYSSGGHVAATVTQNAALWMDRNLPKPRVHCDSMLYISPVLATRAYDAVLRKAPAFKWSSYNAPTVRLTNRVMEAVFDPIAVAAVPSPILTYDRSPRVPHVFVGCKNEMMFGLTWLDTFFCSSDYSGLLNGMGIESRYRSIRSDHWKILGSSELRDVLGEELGRIERECRTKGNKAK